jgi:hypothetical protein
MCSRITPPSVVGRSSISSLRMITGRPRRVRFRNGLAFATCQRGWEDRRGRSGHVRADLAAWRQSREQEPSDKRPAARWTARSQTCEGGRSPRRRAPSALMPQRSGSPSARTTSANHARRFVQAASAGAPRDREVTMRDGPITLARASHQSACSAAQRACDRATRDFSVLLMFRTC